MLEKEVIQSVGFRNIKENGHITGFQFKIRLPYYRGIFPSQIRPGTLYVDEKKFEKEDLIWVIQGKEFSYEELRTDTNTHWAVTEPATIKVKTDNGLTQGVHKLTFGFCFTSSYMPPSMQVTLNPDKESEIFMPEFGHHVNTRNLIIV